MEINMIQKLDEWYKEWRGVSHLEESNVQVLDSSEAQDFARYCIGEFQTLQASEDKSKLLLADVSESAIHCASCVSCKYMNLVNGDCQNIDKLDFLVDKGICKYWKER
jgi:hypothetical protein